MVVAGILVAGCSSAEEQDAATVVASAFSAHAASDASAACALLAPDTRAEVEATSGTDCAKGLAGLHLPAGGAVTTTVVAGHSAQARLGHDTIFLALFDEGWRVTAAGCQRDDADEVRPYQCLVKAG
jgi:hypothetical protein